MSLSLHFTAIRSAYTLRGNVALYEKRGVSLSTSDGLYVGIKLLGVYFLCIAVRDIPSAFGAIGLVSGGETDDSAGPLALYLLSAIILFALGMLLTIKTKTVYSLLTSSNDNPLPENPITMGGALKLLGVYLAVTSAARVVSNIGVSIAEESSFLVKISLYGPSIITCSLGILLAVKGQKIWNLISE